jgi:hypothetical protein
MEHTINLSAGRFIKEVAPTSVQALLKKVQRAVKNAGTDDGIDLDHLDEELAGLDDGDGDGLDASEPDVDFDVGDTMGKALALITQASAPKM